MYNKLKVFPSIFKKRPNFIDQIIKDAHPLDLVTEDRGIFPVLFGDLNTKRLRNSFEHIVYGLYFHEFSKKLIGKVTLLFGFVRYKENNLNNFMSFIKTRFDCESDNYKKTGSNQDIFYYQIVPPDQYGVVLFKMVFFGGTDVYAAIEPEGCNIDSTPLAELFKLGIPVTIKYNGKDYDV
jgi:hypothetical protein